VTDHRGFWGVVGRFVFAGSGVPRIQVMPFHVATWLRRGPRGARNGKESAPAALLAEALPPALKLPVAVSPIKHNSAPLTVRFPSRLGFAGPTPLVTCLLFTYGQPDWDRTLSDPPVAQMPRGRRVPGPGGSPPSTLSTTSPLRVILVVPRKYLGDRQFEAAREESLPGPRPSSQVRHYLTEPTPGFGTGHTRRTRTGAVGQAVRMCRCVPSFNHRSPPRPFTVH